MTEPMEQIPSQDDPGDGWSRRRVLKGGAVAGAVAWAVPTAQVIGMGSAHAQAVSPPPPPPPPPPDDCKAISNIQIIVSSGGTLYGLKWDPEEGGFNDWSSAAPDSNDCIRYYEMANAGTTVVALQAVADDFNEAPATVTMVNDCEWRLALPLPAGYTFVAGYSKSGDVSSEECPPAATSGGSYIVFTGPPN